ncbi:hypothetical protein QQ045_012303 [Rhodiola kirilowii]
MTDHLLSLSHHIPASRIANCDLGRSRSRLSQPCERRPNLHRRSRWKTTSGRPFAFQSRFRQSSISNDRRSWSWLLPLKMNDQHLSDLFQQLVYARLLQPPYDKYGGWKDDQLWMFKHDRLSQSSVRRIMNIVLKYTKDSQLQDMEDSSLKKNICLVFNHMTTVTDYLRAEFLEDQQDMGNPSFCSKGTQPPIQASFRSDNYSN